jgi:DNA-binding transcriptional MerR regulator
MLIGAMSRQTGVSERLLRYYEEQGLLAPRRRAGGFREYRPDDITTVRDIRTLLAAGFRTQTIRDLLPYLHRDKVLDAHPPGALSSLHRERKRISDTAAGLLAACEVLDTVIATMQPDAPEERSAAAPP